MRLSTRGKPLVLFPALLLLSSVSLRNDTNTIPAGRWRYDRFITKGQLPVTVECRFHVLRGPAVRVELLTDENLTALRARESYEAIASSTDGRLVYRIGVPGVFAIVVLNNDKSKAADVALKLSLDSSPGQSGVSETVPPNRKLAIVALSLAGFLAIVSVSAALLLRAMRNAKTGL